MIDDINEKKSYFIFYYKNLWLYFYFYVISIIPFLMRGLSDNGIKLEKLFKLL